MHRKRFWPIVIALAVCLATATADDMSPPRAHAPAPPDGATGVKHALQLNWSTSGRAPQFDVYFGTDAEAVENATNLSPQYKGRGTYDKWNTPEFAPGELAWFTTYYWRIDEVNDLDPNSPYKGDLWSFTTADHLIIDDFEDYNNFTPRRVFETWIDGYNDPANGSVVGYPGWEIESYMETHIVHGGAQSMPYLYDTAPMQCLASRDLPGLNRNWTVHNFVSLSVWVRGRPAPHGSFVESPPGTFTIMRMGEGLPADIWWPYCHDHLHYAWKQLDGSGVVTARVDSISGEDLWNTSAGLMIRETLDPDSPKVFVRILSDFNGLGFGYRPAPPEFGCTATVAWDDTSMDPPHWLKLQRGPHDSFSASHAYDVNGSPGQWVELGSVDVPIASIAYAGLAVTVRLDRPTPVEAVLSRVSISGNVTDQNFTGSNIGGNDPARIYVELEDAAAYSARAYHSDPNVCTTDAWTEWNIPLTDFAGIDLNDVNTFSVGFEATGPTDPGGTGLVYFDDIRVCPAPSVPDNDLYTGPPVDYLDLDKFVDDWLWTGRPGGCKADLNFDGVVDCLDYADFATRWSTRSASVAIIVDHTTYNNLAPEIDRLAHDITNDLDVDVFIYPDTWQDIFQVRQVLTERYHRSGLVGSILIGDVPTAYFEFKNSGATPTDWYYQDLSDEFVDSDGDGKFEREFYALETDVTLRDIWAGRLKPPVGGGEGIMLLKRYLDNNHRYRTGQLTYRQKMLYFGSIALNQSGMSQTDYENLVAQIDTYTGLYESDDDVNYIYHPDLETQKQLYLAELSNSYEFVFVNIHGSVTTQWLGDSTSLYSSEMIQARPRSLLSIMSSCSNGDFTQDYYLAGWYLFSGETLAVMANSTVSMAVGGASVEFLKDFVPLGLGVTFGEMYRNDRSASAMHLFGDPTLTLRPIPTGDVPDLALDKSHLDFGSVPAGTKPRGHIIFTNNGSNTLRVIFKKGRFSIDGKEVNPGYWDVFYYQHPETGDLFREFEVPPGDFRLVPFVFYPRSDGPLGTYTMTMLFQTNAPQAPYVNINLRGDAFAQE